MGFPISSYSNVFGSHLSRHEHPRGTDSASTELWDNSRDSDPAAGTISSGISMAI